MNGGFVGGQVEVELRETLNRHSPNCGSLVIDVFVVADSRLMHYVVSKMQAVFRGKMARRRVLEVLRICVLVCTVTLSWSGWWLRLIRVLLVG